MPRRPRRNHPPAFKAKVALEVIKDEEPVIVLAERFDVRPNQITTWKGQLLEGAAAVFGEGEKDTSGIRQYSMGGQRLVSSHKPEEGET